MYHKIFSQQNTLKETCLVFLIFNVPLQCYCSNCLLMPPELAFTDSLTAYCYFCLSNSTKCVHKHICVYVNVIYLHFLLMFAMCTLPHECACRYATQLLRIRKSRSSSQISSCRFATSHVHTDEYLICYTYSCCFEVFFSQEYIDDMNVCACIK